MIQDLGQKHKPMLPEVPVDDEDMDGEDTKSHQNIENWAKTVGEDVAGGEGEDVDVAPPQQDDTPYEEGRVQRFDRPMKEIRVGESPSRPWGVPIPAKFLDRNASFADSIARAPLDIATNPAVTAAPPKPDESTIVHPSNLSDIPNDQISVERPKGKCPFDRLAMRGKAMKEAYSAPHAGDDKSALPANVPAIVLDASQQPQVDAPVDDTEFPEHNHDAAPTIVNHGIAIIGTSQSFNGHRLVNHGTLIIGHGLERTNQTLAQIMKLGKADR